MKSMQCRKLPECIDRASMHCDDGFLHCGKSTETVRCSQNGLSTEIFMVCSSHRKLTIDLQNLLSVSFIPPFFYSMFVFELLRSPEAPGIGETGHTLDNHNH